MVSNVVHGVGQFFENIFSGPPKPPTLQAPDALSKTPTREEAATTATQKQLEQERMAASTSTVLTGGAGLNAQPTTTSQVLIGN